MSKIILIITGFFLLSSVCVESIYTHSVKSIEGIEKPLDALQGKKILITTLPLEQNNANDSLLHSLDSLRAAYNGSLIIIAVPAYEDGYTPSRKEDLKLWYRSILGTDIIVTEGLYTRKASAGLQHPLFKWLTEKNRNNHFETELNAPGEKFIVWTNGELVGVLGARTKPGSSVIHEILQ